ncbi:MAG: aldo/keto reductase [bacterium]
MLYRELGKTKEKISILGFGCMRLPILDGNAEQINENKASEMIKYALSKGVNYFDTAFPYHSNSRGKGGASEVFLGNAIKQYRNKVYLATKLPSWLIKTRSDMDRYLDLQLERLQTDYIDFYLLHCLNIENWNILSNSDVFNFLESAKQDGRIKYAGFSFHDEFPLFKNIVDSYDWSFCQIQYNYMDENYQAGTQGLNYAKEKGLGTIIMEPLRGGGLANVVPSDIQENFDKAEIKKSPVEWALRFLWNKPEVDLVLSGMSELNHVIENIDIAKRGCQNSLTGSDLAILDEVKSIYASRSKVNCTGCNYCMPCPVGVNIPANFAHFNNFYIYKYGAYAKMQYANFIGDMQKAKQCVQCGKCENECPQNIPIIEMLKEVTKTFTI